MVTSYSENPKEATNVTPEDWMGIESGGVGLPHMKKVKLKTLLKQVNDKILDNKHAIEKNAESIRSIAIKDSAIGNEIEIIDTLDWPIIGAEFYGETTGGNGSPIEEDPITNITLSSIENRGRLSEQTASIVLPNPIEMAEEDVLILENSNAYVDRIKKKITLTGIEPWESGIVSGGNGRIYRYKLRLPDALVNGERQEVRSNRFTFRNGSASDVGTAFVSDGYLYLYPEQSITTVKDFKSWLLSHNTEVQYKLQKELIEPVTTENQVVLTNLQTFEDYTYFKSNAGNMQVEYVVKTKEYIDGEISKIDEKYKGLSLDIDNPVFRVDQNGVPFPPDQKAIVRAIVKGLSTPVHWDVEGKTIPDGTQSIEITADDLADVQTQIELKNFSNHTNVYKDGLFYWSGKTFSGSDYIYMRAYTLPINHKIYIRQEVKVLSGSKGSIYLEGSGFDNSKSDGISNVSPNANYGVSLLFEPLLTQEGSSFIALRAGLDSDYSVEITDNNCIVLDVTALSAQYPQYSDEQLKAILDKALPYIPAQKSKSFGNRLKLQNELSNVFYNSVWSPNPNVANFKNQNGIVSGDTGVFTNYLNWIHKDVKPLEGKSCFIKVKEISGSNGFFIGVYNWGDANRNYAYSDLPNTGSNQVIIASPTAEISSIRFKPSEGAICVDTQKCLVDLWLELHGIMGNVTRAEWCNKHIPYFDDYMYLTVGVKNRLPVKISSGKHVVNTSVEVVENINTALQSDIVDSGEGYVRFKDGTQICWGESSLESGDKGALYSAGLYYHTIVAKSFPLPFIKRPIVSATANLNSWLCIVSYVACNETNIGHMQILTGDETTSSLLSIGWIAVGKWK